ncbi:Hypothetical protein R9X50_00563800 [Acrodontium crateriforme]|uniref:DUF2428 domain-containing protein n=1 Tax=Acrodontium crateriforme TaxID=150365 RepID=A0AAQ3M7J8_9PEZI|nr:Hypothetical protein R9X50_00563800 [Acrodontium crateriforme]
MTATDLLRHSGEDILSEDDLRKLSKSVKSLLPKDADDLRLLEDNLARLLEAVTAANITSTHRAAAWNTLCALIDQCSASPEAFIKEFLWNFNIWTRAFDAHISQAHNARPKSSRQVLITLTSAMQKAPENVIDMANIKRRCVQRQLVCLIDENDQSKARACASSLAHFLSKEVVTLNDVLAVLNFDKKNVPIRAKLEILLLSLFEWMGKGDFGSAIANLVSAILVQTSSLETLSQDSNLPSAQPIWTEPLIAAFQSSMIETSSVRAHLLPVLFKQDLNDYVTFLNTLGMEDLFSSCPKISPSSAEQESREELLLASLQAGKELGLVYETESDQISHDKGGVYIPVSGIIRLLARGSRSARLSGLSLIACSHSITRPICQTALSGLKSPLPRFFADSDAFFRGEVFGLVQRLVDRIRAVTAVLARQCEKINGATNLETHDGSRDTLKCHRDFLEWLISCLTWELRPTASYQRHISGLRCLSIIAKSGLDSRIDSSCWSRTALGETKWPFTLQVLTPRLRRLLLDLLIDPFDDVRQLAASILKLPLITTEDAKSTQNMHDVQQALDRAESAMLATGRADHADGVANLYSLLHHQSEVKNSVIDRLIEKLDKMLEIGRTDITQAVERYPAHGLLTSLRYVLTQDISSRSLDSEVKSRLSKCLHDIWTVVHPVLCDDAPEGYLPEGLEESVGVSTKDTLSYCWRALKEASLLLGVLISSPSSDATIDQTVFESLSDLCFTQLAELRHRGAFSTVAQTWTTCCIQASSQPTNASSKLQAWYDKVVLILRNKTTINTRRSAGLPSLLCGLLIAENSGVILKQAFSDMEFIAREQVDPNFAQEGSLPQVHAMNCLKDILKNTRLGEKSEKYIPVTLQLAADALRSVSWAVRNCGLMLFRGVIDRLLGTSDSNNEDDEQKRIPADQHPELLDIVFKLLSTPAATPTGLSSGSEGVFPALHLLQRMDVPDTQLDEVRQAVFALTASSSWHIRDKAARTYASFVDESEVLVVLEGFLKNNNQSQNALHGALLCSKEIIGRLTIPYSQSNDELMNRSDTQVDLGLSLVETITKYTNLYHYNRCQFSRGAYLDVLSAALALLASAKFSGGAIGRTTPITSRQTTSELGSLSITDALGDMLSRPKDGRYKDTVPLTALARSYALYVALQLGPESDTTNFQANVLRLAEHDADAGVEYFRTLNTIDLDITTLNSSLPESILQNCSNIDQHKCESRVRCEAQRTVLHVLGQITARRHEVSNLSTLLSPWLSMEALQDEAINPEYADLWLQIHAIALESASIAGSASSNDLNTLVESFSIGIQETGLFSREATALSINRLNGLWKVLVERGESSSSQFLRLCIMIYDLLNDDDEDVRQLASSATSRILVNDAQKTTLPDLEVIVASQKLMAFIVKTWPDSPVLMREIFARAFGVTSQREEVLDTLTPQLRELDSKTATTTDTALFAEEKQNLYIDESREVRIWTQALLAVLPKHLPPKSLTTVLANSVPKNLDLLMQRTSLGADGALGWTSMPANFPLGLQVIYSAEALLRLVECGLRTPVAASEVRQKLGELSTLFEQRDVNGWWRAELDRVLSKSMEHKVKNLGTLLRAVGLSVNTIV